MVCWRYRTIVFEFKKNGLLGDRFIDDEEVESTLNEQGRIGWELVSATMVQDGLLTLLKQPVFDGVNRQKEEQKGGLFNSEREIVNSPAVDENFPSGVSGNDESVQDSGNISGCMVGEIKIN